MKLTTFLIAILFSFGTQASVVRDFISHGPEKNLNKNSHEEKNEYILNIMELMKNIKLQKLDIEDSLYGDKPIIISTDYLEDPEQMCENCAKKDAHPLEYLRLYLIGLKFHKIYKSFFAGYYGINTLNECYFKTSPFHKLTIKNRVNALGIDLEQSVAKFWILGRAMSKSDEIKFFGKNKKLLASLIKLGIVYRNSDKKLKLKALTLSSVPLLESKALFLFSDLPSCHGGPKNGGARLSTTSLVTLKQLLYEYKRDKSRFENYKTIADFGSGVGILGLAALKLAPQMKMAIGLEIDPKAIALSRYNALLNQEGKRFKVIKNIPTANLTKALKGQKLDFAMANPPYNTFPQKFKKHFPTFGYGGSNGLAVTSIFIDQVNQHLKDNGRFIFYSQLAETVNIASGDPITFLALKINNNHRYKFKTELMKHDWGRFTTKQYAFGLNLYLEKAYPCSPIVSSKSLQRELEKSSISSFNHYYVTMIKKEKLPSGEVNRVKPERFSQVDAHFKGEIEDSYTLSHDQLNSNITFLHEDLEKCLFKLKIKFKLKGLFKLPKNKK